MTKHGSHCSCRCTTLHYPTFPNNLRPERGSAVCQPRDSVSESFQLRPRRSMRLKDVAGDTHSTCGRTPHTSSLMYPFLNAADGSSPVSAPERRSVCVLVTVATRGSIEIESESINNL